jgi:hypothetical protein
MSIKVLKFVKRKNKFLRKNIMNKWKCIPNNLIMIWLKLRNFFLLTEI